MDRQQLREMLDLVPRSQLSKVEDLLRFVMHPMQVCRDSARYGNQPLPEELLARLEEANRDDAQTFTIEEVMAALGIDPAALASVSQGVRITNLDRWVCEHQPGPDLSYGKGWWDFIEDIRRFGDKLQLDEIDVVGTYILRTPPPQEELLSPVVAIQNSCCCVHLKHDFGQHNAAWTMSVRGCEKGPSSALALFLDPSPLTDRALKGLDPDWIFPPYEPNGDRFTTRMADHLDVYAALRLLFSGDGNHNLVG